MRIYELTIILDPTLDDADSKAEIEKIEKLITGSDGKVIKINHWGVRRLTYLIKKHNQGNYVFFLIQANPGISAVLEKSIRINENILRHLIVLSNTTENQEKIEVSKSEPDEDAETEE